MPAIGNVGELVGVPARTASHNIPTLGRGQGDASLPHRKLTDEMFEQETKEGTGESTSTVESTIAPRKYSPHSTNCAGTKWMAQSRLHQAQIGRVREATGESALTLPRWPALTPE